MPNSVHPEFFCDTATWEVGGLVARSLRELKSMLPRNTHIIGYYPHGFTAPKFEDTGSDFYKPNRALLLHSKPPGRKIKEAKFYAARNKSK